MTPIAFWPLTYPWLLLWAAAAAVPILIHLWSRRRYRETPWAAMSYLLAALRKNARRLRIEQLILLAIRVLILVLLAVALADPVLRWFAAGPDAPRLAGDTHWLLVIDSSYSMDYRPDESSRFDRARQLAAERARACRQGDGITLITLADPPQTLIAQPAFEPKDVVAEIEQLSRTDGGGDLLATLATVEKTLEEVRQTRRRLKRARVCFFTDLGRTSWDAIKRPSVRAVLARIAARAELQVVDVGQPDTGNLAVVSVAADQSVATTATPARLDAEVENFGNEDRQDVRAEFLVDGQTVAEQFLRVPAGERSTFSITHRFALPGEHVVTARLHEDRLPVDNQRRLSLPVRSALRVLCVEGKVGAARNIAYALEPGLSGPRRIQAEVRTENALWEEDLTGYDCVFLCNVGQLGPEEAGLLYDYLAGGGGVVFFLGDQVDLENYNRVLGPGREQERVLPVELLAAVGPGQFVFDPLEYAHPIVEPFRGNEQAGLLTTPIWKFIRMEADPGLPVRIALAFDTGDPAIAESRVGLGRVIVVSTAGSSQSMDLSSDPPTPWSALAVWPSFPPLVQQMLVHAVSGRRDARNVLVGEALTVTLPVSVRGSWVTMTDPAGASRRLPLDARGGRSRCRVAGLRRSGVYTIRWGPAEDQVLRFAVNLDTRESRLDRLEPDRLPEAFAQPAEPARTGVRASEPPEPHSLFRYVLAIVLGLLLIETLLAWRFGRATA